MRFLLGCLSLFAICGCTTLEERLAKRTGCDPAKTVVTERLNVPAYDQYKVTCGEKRFVCRDAPFYSTCGPDDGPKKQH